ncbi:hypothetical protein MML48_10g00021478 [Holotrichia oblita]|uniref:Uncharacterized protein n=1 Tax=Holotrichia oblita TaxID=644536 RepID=A0ACB9SFS8_HOLOL|nr:hypothetical protein MML48_10g00021478 [Holotrichia oblita]
MGGTDLMDENIACYRIGIRSKKGWWSIFTWLLDAAVNNSWILFKQNRNIYQLDFRREINQSYLKMYENPSKRAGRPPISKSSISMNRISDEVRYDGRRHLLTVIPNKKGRRCAGEGCSSCASTKCTKCDIGICLESAFILELDALYGVKCRDGLNNLPISAEKIKTIRTEEELETLWPSSNDTQEKIVEDLDPTNNYVPDENFTSTENEMTVEKRCSYK